MAGEDRPFGPDPNGVANRLFKRVSGLLGPNVARMSIRHFAQKKLGIEPEQIKPEHAAALCLSLKPLLRSMLGDFQAEALVKQLQSELKQ